MPRTIELTVRLRIVRRSTNVNDRAAPDHIHDAAQPNFFAQLAFLMSKRPPSSAYDLKYFATIQGCGGGCEDLGGCRSS
jgi:hypothetical protein